MRVFCCFNNTCIRKWKKKSPLLCTLPSEFLLPVPFHSQPKFPHPYLSDFWGYEENPHWGLVHKHSLCCCCASSTMHQLHLAWEGNKTQKLLPLVINFKWGWTLQPSRLPLGMHKFMWCINKCKHRFVRKCLLAWSLGKQAAVAEPVGEASSDSGLFFPPTCFFSHTTDISSSKTIQKQLHSHFTISSHMWALYKSTIGTQVYLPWYLIFFVGN